MLLKFAPFKKPRKPTLELSRKRVSEATTIHKDDGDLTYFQFKPRLGFRLQRLVGRGLLTVMIFYQQVIYYEDLPKLTLLLLQKYLLLDKGYQQ